MEKLAEGVELGNGSISPSQSEMEVRDAHSCSLQTALHRSVQVVADLQDVVQDQAAQIADLQEVIRLMKENQSQVVWNPKKVSADTPTLEEGEAVTDLPPPKGVQPNPQPAEAPQANATALALQMEQLRTELSTTLREELRAILLRPPTSAEARPQPQLILSAASHGTSSSAPTNLESQHGPEMAALSPGAGQWPQAAQPMSRGVSQESMCRGDPRAALVTLAEGFTHGMQSLCADVLRSLREEGAEASPSPVPTQQQLAPGEAWPFAPALEFQPALEPFQPPLLAPSPSFQPVLEPVVGMVGGLPSGITSAGSMPPQLLTPPLSHRTWVHAGSEPSLRLVPQRSPSPVQAPAQWVVKSPVRATPTPPGSLSPRGHSPTLVAVTATPLGRQIIGPVAHGASPRPLVPPLRMAYSLQAPTGPPAQMMSPLRPSASAARNPPAHQLAMEPVTAGAGSPRQYSVTSAYSPTPRALQGMAPTTGAPILQQGPPTSAPRSQDLGARGRPVIQTRDSSVGSRSHTPGGRVLTYRRVVST